jgi:NADPH:quinone reductase-like Zn-dependent oxidoreductase
MRAITFDAFGDAGVLELQDDVPDPKVGPDSVLIRVQAAGVNPVDHKIRQGYLEPAFPHRFPIVPGWDAAGVVEAVGPAVVGLEPGDPVWSYARKTEVHGGTYAELVSVPAGAVTRRPEALSVVEAGGVPLAGLTAYQALTEKLAAGPGRTVAITAAAGGVGHFAVQIAKALGATVVALAGTRHHDFLRGLGADVVVDGHADDVPGALREALGGEPDALLDLFGADWAAQAVRAGGDVASIATPDIAAGRDDVQGHYVFVRPSAAELDALGELAQDGRLRVEVAETFPLERAADAQRLVEDGHVRGKVVLTV